MNKTKGSLVLLEAGPALPLGNLVRQLPKAPKSQNFRKEPGSRK